MASLGIPTVFRAGRSDNYGLVPRDSFNREIDYLRLSVIDACNLRCVYCMPLEGLRFLPKEELLTPAEFETVARAADHRVDAHGPRAGAEARGLKSHQRPSRQPRPRDLERQMRWGSFEKIW